MTDDQISVIGTGLTGAPLSSYLAGSHHVVAWDRERSNLEQLDGVEVVLAESAAAAVSGSRRVIIDVFDDKAVEEVCAGPDGLLASIAPGALVADLSTTSLETKFWLGEELAERGANLIEAPFFGSVTEISHGRIWTAVGCDERLWPDAKHFLEVFSIPTRVGDLGAATRFKLATNVLTFSMVQLIAEAIALARALDFDPSIVLDVIADGTGVRSPIYQVKGRAMIAGDFQPKATIDLARKDLRLILDAAAQRHLRLPLTEAAKHQFDEAADSGWSRSDMARVYQLLEPATDG